MGITACDKAKITVCGVKRAKKILLKTNAIGESWNSIPLKQKAEEFPSLK
jgi:hypothetical protein